MTLSKIIFWGSLHATPSREPRQKKRLEGAYSRLRASLASGATGSR